jgi:prepilin-type N-terminal cleavage/methylation domain-containing protein
MELRKIYINKILYQNGFTLLEVLIVLMMLSVIACATLFFSMSFYSHNLILAERSQFISLLQTVRAQSMQNIDNKPHGIAIDVSEGNKYILFSGSTLTTSDPESQIPILYDTRFRFSTDTPDEIVFSQLSGESNYEGEILMIDSFRPQSIATITINYGGAIY